MRRHSLPRIPTAPRVPHSPIETRGARDSSPIETRRQRPDRPVRRGIPATFTEPDTIGAGKVERWSG